MPTVLTFIFKQSSQNVNIPLRVYAFIALWMNSENIQNINTLFGIKHSKSCSYFDKIIQIKISKRQYRLKVPCNVRGEGAGTNYGVIIW